MRLSSLVGSNYVFQSFLGNGLLLDRVGPLVSFMTLVEVGDRLHALLIYRRLQHVRRGDLVPPLRLMR